MDTSFHPYSCCYTLGEEEMVMTILQAMTPLAVHDRQIFVPVRAVGNSILDNGGDTIAVCANDTLAAGIASAINQDAARDPYATIQAVSPNP